MYTQSHTSVCLPPLCLRLDVMSVLAVSQQQFVFIGKLESTDEMFLCFFLFSCKHLLLFILILKINTYFKDLVQLDASPLVLNRKTFPLNTLSTHKSWNLTSNFSCKYTYAYSYICDVTDSAVHVYQQPMRFTHAHRVV